MAISTRLRVRLRVRVRVRVPFKIKMFLMHERFLMERNEMKANGLEVNQPARDDNASFWVVLGVESWYPGYEYYINTHTHTYISLLNPIRIPNQKPHPQMVTCFCFFPFPEVWVICMYVGSTGSVASSLVTMTLVGGCLGAEEI